MAKKKAAKKPTQSARQKKASKAARIKARKERIDAIKPWVGPVGSTLGVVGLVVGVIAGLGWLNNRATHVLGMQGRVVQIDWPALSGKAGEQRTWLPVSEQQELQVLAEMSLHQEQNPLNADMLAQMSARLESSGWFAEHPRVSREQEGVVRVKGEWRVPGAVVRSGNKDYLVATDGRLLPPVYARDGSGLPVLMGASFDPPADGSGSIWVGGDVQAGLALVGVIRTEPWFGQVAGIDISGYSGKGILEIVTDTSSRVVWGASPTQWVAGEVSTAQKIQTLTELQRRFGRIDAGKKRIEIQFQEVLVDDTLGG